jgi:hypothetical protein
MADVSRLSDGRWQGSFQSLLFLVVVAGGRAEVSKPSIQMNIVS